MPDILGEKTITDEEKSESVTKLRLMLKEQEDLKNLHDDDEYLQRYLYGNEFNVEAAFNKMKMFYDLVIEYPNWFQKVAPLDKKWFIEQHIRIMTSERDKEGRPIYILKLGNVDISKMELFDVIAVDDIWIEALLASDPLITGKGLCVIVDVANYPWRIMKWLTPEIIKMTVKKIQTLPFINYRFHIVNKAILLQAAMKIIWPFLPQHIKEMIIFHGDDWESLYEHIDQEVLPHEYSGLKNINYNDLYNKLFDRNDEIYSNFSLHRSIIP